MMTTGLLALAMVGVKITTSLVLIELGLTHQYDHRARTLLLDPGLGLDEVGHICDGLLETVVSHSLTGPLALPGLDPAA